MLSWLIDFYQFKLSVSASLRENILLQVKKSGDE